MSTIFITGSADGLGQLAAKELVDQGHRVVLHARNAERGRYAMEKVPGAAGLLIADLSSMDETKSLAEQVNAWGKLDAIIHNAGAYSVPNNAQGRDGFPLLLAVNTIAPYILTCLVQKPQRLIYLSSGMHKGGDPDLRNLTLIAESKNSPVTYSDTKLHDLILAMAVAGIWKDVYSNAVNPGWVPTKMGGAGAPDDLQKGFATQVWLAVGQDPAAKVSGRYFFHKKEVHCLPAAKDFTVQEKFIELCQQITGVPFPQDPKG